MKTFVAFISVLLFSLPCLADNKSEPTDQELIERAAQDRKPNTAVLKELDKKNDKEEPKTEKSDFNKEPKTKKDIKKKSDKVAPKKEEVYTSRFDSNEKEILKEAEQARILPPGILRDWISYPIDWREKAAKRAKYKDGVVAEGNTDADGKKVVIYDITDLTYEVPNFSFEPGFSSGERERQRPSYYDPFAPEKPRNKKSKRPVFSQEQADEIEELIRALVGDDGEVKTIMPSKKHK